MASRTSSYDFRFTPTYSDCITAYQHRIDVLAALQTALQELARQPFGNPALQTHAVERAAEGTFTSYVGTRGHRLIWRQVGRVIVLLLFGEHDAVYRRAERLRLEVDDTQNILRVVDQHPSTEGPQPYMERRAVEGSLFMAWNDRELASFGFDPQEIPVLRRLETEDSLVGLEGRMRPQAWRVAVNLVACGHPSGEMAAGLARQEHEAREAARGESELALVDPAAEKRLQHALLDPRATREFAPIDADEMAAVLARPIEDWMVYLDPGQRVLVERSFSGPARIRGGAGTGKTVVALHRARELARYGNGGRILFTTYTKNLPPIFEQLFRRLSPDLVDRVEFINIHRWANRLLSAKGLAPSLDPNLASTAWARACDRRLATGSVLERGGFTRTYLKEEVDWVIKGRGLTSFDQYAALERNGRGTPLGATHREALWDLYQQYEKEMAALGIADFNDILLRALDLARSGGLPPYEAVIVDEAQDLTEVAVRLLHRVVGDGPNGLLLVGDGQQAVYPGGFRPATLGISLRGRSHVLTRNYRNTRQIIGTASALVAGDRYDDGDGSAGAPDLVEVLRDGPLPTAEGFPTKDDHDLGLAAAIEAAVDAGTRTGDLAVLVSTNALVTEYTSRISSLGLTTQKLNAYDGIPNRHVKVGTYQRAKGLEFKRVFLPRLEPSGVGERRRRGEDDQTYAERMALLRRQLFVAMTRARDGLWLGWIEDAPAGSMVARLRASLS